MHSTKGWPASRIRRASYWRPWLRRRAGGAGQLGSLVGVWTCFGVGTKVWNGGSPYIEQIWGNTAEDVTVR